MENKAKQLIKYFQNMKEDVDLDVYSTVDVDWDFYYSMTGFLNGEYFAIVIRSWKGNETVEIVNTTDCKEKIEKILNHFNLLPTK